MTSSGIRFTQLEFQVFLSHHTLIFYTEAGTERGLGKTLSPHLLRELHGQFEIYFRFVEVAIGFNHMLKIGRREQRLRSLLKDLTKFFEVAST